MSVYFNKLIQTVIELSESDNWQDAVTEWLIEDCEEDEMCKGTCICGKEKLRYLFTIRNTYNQNILFPIGSSCIHKFERDELDEIANNYEDMFRLLHAVARNDYITLDTNYFSRKLLRYLYDKGAFQPSKFNNYTPERDYHFILDMFNKRDKSSITDLQEKKINAIIIGSIKPFLYRILKDKTNTNDL